MLILAQGNTLPVWVPKVGLVDRVGYYERIGFGKCVGLVWYGI